MFGAVAVVAVAACRWPFVPTPGELLGGVAVAADQWSAGMTAAGLAAFAAALGSAWSRRGRSSGGFGVLAGAVVAAGPPLLAASWPLAPTIVGAVAVVGVVVAIAALPLLRERGVLSLALVAAIAVTPPALAFGRAREAAHAATTLHAFGSALNGMPSDLEAIGVLLGADVDARTVAALPLFARGRTLFAVAEDGLEAPWLLRMGMPVLRLHATACTPAQGRRAPLPGRDSRAIRASYLAGADGGPSTGVTVKCEPGRAGDLVVLFTPCGAITGVVDDDGSASFDDDSTARLRQWLAPLPTAPPIRVLVVPPAAADGYGWTDLRQ